MAFHPIDRDTDYLLPPSVQEWLPEAHLARYVVDVIEGLDLTALERAYAGRGSDAYHPATLLSLLIYGYATGTFSSRKIERDRKSTRLNSSHSQISYTALCL